MRYVSTRGKAPVLDFEGVLLAGLARDGGLYMPEQWPSLSAETLESLSGASYGDIAVQVMRPFVEGSLDPGEFEALVRDAYADFGHPAVAPLVQLGPADWALELFHGPTLAFKDMALQLVGRLFAHVLARRRRRVTIVGATSGDTGSAAIEACRGREAIDVFILHPHGRVSEVQRRQMTTVLEGNIHNIAVQGSFDECQALVKAMFNDLDFRDALQLSAVNSINWARVMAQVVYFVSAAVSLGAPRRAVAFSVPTGNFGDVFAGYVAERMGLPVARLIVATNRNDILARFLASGEYRKGTVEPTMSPSMDIQVSSNFERLLFDLFGRDGAAVAHAMDSLGASGGFRVEAARLAAATALFQGCRIDEDETRAGIADCFARTGWLPDPHTAVALQAAAKCRGSAAVPMVTLATAHPAKFPDAVSAAAGVRPALPGRLADLLDRPERFEVLPADVAAVQSHIRQRARLGAGAELA